MADKKISQLTAATTPLAGTEVLPIVQSSSTVKVAVSNLTAGRAVSVGSLDSAGDASVGTGNAGLTQVTITTTGEAADQKNWRLQTGTGIGAGVLRLRAINDAGSSGQNAWVVTRTADNIDSHSFLTGGSARLGIGASDVTFNTGNLIQGTAAKGVNFTANTPAAGMTSQLLNWYEEGAWTPTQGAGLTVTGTFASSGLYTRVGRMVMVKGTISATSISCTSGQIMCGGMPFTANGDQPGSWFNATLDASGVLDAAGTSLYAVGAIGATTAILFSAVYFV